MKTFDIYSKSTNEKMWNESSLREIVVMFDWLTCQHIDDISSLTPGESITIANAIFVNTANQ